MASIETRKRNGTTSYRVTWRDPDRRQRSKTFTRKVDAQQFRATVEADMVRGSYVDPHLGARTTFAEYLQQYQATRVHRPATAAAHVSRFAHHVLPVFGSRPLASVQRSDVQAWVTRLSQVLAATTVRTIYRETSGVFAEAVRDGYIVRTPCTKISLPKIDAGQIVPLTPAEVAAIVAATPDRYRAVVMLCAGCGLRQGEAFGLTVDRVDFLRRTVRIDRQLVTVAGRAPYLGPPKTPSSNRSVPLPAVVAEALAAHLARYGAGTDGLIFTTSTGGPVRRNRAGDMFTRAVAAAGAPDGTTLHDLRHFYASLLIESNQSVKVVQNRLGHTSAAMTLDVYGHLWPDSEADTMAAVDRVLGAVSL